MMPPTGLAFTTVKEALIIVIVIYGSEMSDIKANVSSEPLKTVGDLK
jgi:hypothetical protein